MQLTEFLGQLLTDMVMINTIVLAITNKGISQVTHFLKCLISRNGLAAAGAGADAGAESDSSGCITLLFRRELTLIWMSDAIGYEIGERKRNW